MKTLNMQIEMNINIIEIINAIQEGKEYRLKELIEIYNPTLKSVAQYYLDSMCDVEDVIQEVWIKVLKYFYTLKNPDKFSSWLVKIVRYHCLNFLKKNIRYESRNISIDMETRHELFSMYLCTEDNCWKNIENKDLKRIINKILKKMPETYSLLLKLFYMDNFKIKEICELLNLPVSTVKWRLYQAKASFKAHTGNLLKNMINIINY